MKTRTRKCHKQALAVFGFIQAFLDGDDITDQELADYAGCNRTSIYAMSVLTRIREKLAALEKANLPRGEKGVNEDGYQKTSYFEAWDSETLSPLDQLIAKEEAESQG